MVISRFRSRLRQENADEFQELADRMMKLAEVMPGFISYKRYTSDDTLHVTDPVRESHFKR